MSLEELRALNMEEDYYESRPHSWDCICLYEVVQYWRHAKEKPRNGLDVSNIPYAEIEGLWWIKKFYW